MNIVYLDHYAGSSRHGRSFRPYYLGQEWHKQGHKLLVVAGSYSHLRQTQPDKTGFEEIDDITYLWLRTPHYDGNGMRRALSMLVFMMQLFFAIPSILRFFKPDAVVASSVYMLDVFPGWLLKKIARVNLVFELHDLWPASLIERGGMGRRHPFVLLMRGAEYCAYKLCDRVISILPDTYAHMRQFQVQATHFTHVPNGIYMPDWEKQSTVSDEFSNFLQQVAGPDVFTVGYAGAYGDASDLDMLLEAAFILKDHDDINFVFVGQGTQKPAMDEFVKEHGLKNMHICNAIPKAQIPDFLSRMDTLYIGLKDKPLMQYGASPNKVFDYMMAGKPLLYGINSSNDFTALAQCGYKVDGGNPHNIADGILKLAGLDAAQRCEMGENGRHYVLAHHRYEVLADNFLKALES